MTAHISKIERQLVGALPFDLNAPSDSALARPLGTAQPCQVFMAAPNGEIYGQGERATALYQVTFGAVRLYRLLADGRRQISAFYVPGEVFGFEADSHHHFFAEATCGSAIRIFRKPHEGDTARWILPMALQALVRAQEHLLVIGRQSASERVAAFLIDMMERQGGLPSIELAMPRSDIADYLGLTIETVSRTFSKFKARQYIRLSSARAVLIAKPDALRALSS